MSMEILLKIREMGREVTDKRAKEEIDFEYMTAPCGLPYNENLSQNRLIFLVRNGATPRAV